VGLRRLICAEIHIGETMTKLTATVAVASAALLFSGCASAKPLEIKRTFDPKVR
jgi:hypothetical protein